MHIHRKLIKFPSNKFLSNATEIASGIFEKLLTECASKLNNKLRHICLYYKTLAFSFDDLFFITNFKSAVAKTN